MALICFANSSFNDFTYDDNAIVRENPRIRSLGNFRDTWLTDWWFEYSDDAPIVNPARDRLYRPLTLFTFALNYAGHGPRPAGYHLVNIALHAAVCFLVWQFARRLFQDATIASVGAVLFATHPVHAEAVAGIVGRGEILAAGFVLLGLLALMPRAEPAGAKRCGLAALAFLAAMLSKETAVCYPAVALLVLHTVTREQRPSSKWWLGQIAFLLIPLAVYFPLRYDALGQHLMRQGPADLLFNPLQETNLAGRLHGPLTILGHYARLLIAPSKLSCDYGLAVIDPDKGPQLITLVGVLAACGLLLCVAGYRSTAPTWRRLAVLGAIFVASYGLISNTVILIGVAVAERLMYWPSVPALLGLSVAAVGFWRRYCRPGGPLHTRGGLLHIFGVLLLVAFGLRTIVRNSDWKNDERLFTIDLKTYPQSAHLNNALANTYIWHATRTPDTNIRDKFLDSAESLLRRALAVRARFADALRNLGVVYLLRGNEQKALDCLENALWLNPTDKRAQRYAMRIRGEAPANEQRVADLRRQIEKRPDDAALRVKLAEVLIGLGRNYEALQQSQQAARLAPSDPAALRSYGEALLVNQLKDQALEVFGQVLKLEPADWRTHSNVAQLLSDRDPQAALRHAQTAVELQPNHLQTQLNLAEALVLNGRVPEALQRLSKILHDLPQDHPSRELIADRIAELERKHR